MSCHGRSRRVLAPASVAAILALAPFAPVARAQSAPAGEAPAVVTPPPAPSAGSARVRATRTIRLGYRANARPFSLRDEAGRVAGYSVELCNRVVDSLKTEPGMAGLKAEWVEVTTESRFRALQDGTIDLLCSGDTETISRSRDVGFSIPIFAGGIGAVVGFDAPEPLKTVLSGSAVPRHPVWRASAGTLLSRQTFSVIQGTTAETWLRAKMGEFQLTADVVTVDGYESGVARVMRHESNVFFGDRSMLLEAVAHSSAPKRLVVLDRMFTHEHLALAFPRGDDDMRLAVDGALSRFYGTKEFEHLFATWFGKPAPEALDLLRMSALPE